MKLIKSIKPIFLVAFVFSFLTFACKSDDDGGNGGLASSGTITAKVNGNSLTTLNLVTSANLVSGNLMIQGNTGGTNAKSITLLIMGVNGTGTYPIGGGANINNSASYIELSGTITNPQTTTWQAPYDSNQVGEIKISEMTATQVKGTFNYKAKNTTGDQSIKEITEGSFNLSL